MKSYKRSLQSKKDTKPRRTKYQCFSFAPTGEPPPGAHTPTSVTFERGALPNDPIETTVHYVKDGDNSLPTMSPNDQNTATAFNTTIAVVQLAAYETSEIVSKYAGFLARASNILGTYNAYNNWNKNKTPENLGKLIINVAAVFAKDSPIGLTVTVAYNILDISGYNPIDLVSH